MTDVHATWQRGRIVTTEPAADGIARIVVETELAARAQPGSHIDVRVRYHRDGTEITDVRSYSIAEASADGRRLTLGVQLSPTSRGGSRFMHSLTAGAELELTTPLQNFPLRIGAQRYVLIAGGVGITAITAIAATLRRVGADYTLIFAARSRGAMAFVDELEALHGERLVVHAGDRILDVPALVADVANGPASTEIYMCGPIGLMDAVRQAWANHGLPEPNLRYETFGSSGRYDAEDFVVRIPRLGVETVVGSGESMLDALERSGVDAMYDCRKGECGLCQVDVLDHDGELDHRDVFLSDKQKTESRKIVACVSRIARGAGCPNRTATLVLDLP